MIAEGTWCVHQDNVRSLRRTGLGPASSRADVERWNRDRGIARQRPYNARPHSCRRWRWGEMARKGTRVLPRARGAAAQSSGGLGTGSRRIARGAARVLVFEQAPAVAGAHPPRAAGIKRGVPSLAPRHLSKRPSDPHSPVHCAWRSRRSRCPRRTGIGSRRRTVSSAREEPG